MSVSPPKARQLLSTPQVLALQQAADRVFVHHAVSQYAVALVMATREPARYGVVRSPGTSSSAPRRARPWAWSPPPGRSP